MSATARIAELKRRIKRSAAALAQYERMESELRSLPKSDDPVRFRALLKANAEIANATKFKIASYFDELDLLTYGGKKSP